jgi:hypothetical protein
MKKQDDKFESSFNFDLERMQKSVSAPKLKIPRGLTREERRKFIKKAVQ